MIRCFAASVMSLMLAGVASAQTPQPFPRPAQRPAQPPTAPSTPPPAPAPSAPQTQPPSGAKPANLSKEEVPTEAMLGAPIYPSAVYLTSYDAGRGQRFYLFGVTVPYAEMVGFYRTVLKQKGDELYEAPPTHQFETGKFREESMAFVPSVTIKDYTYGGSSGYPNPKPGASPDRFPTVIQIVPAPR